MMCTQSQAETPTRLRFMALRRLIMKLCITWGCVRVDCGWFSLCCVFPISRQSEKATL